MIPRYTLPEMGAIWSEAARFEAMLRVELAVARAQTARGQIPPDALVALETRSHVDVDRILEIERTTDHDVIAFVSQVAEAVGPEGRYLHLGLTSSDVVDTGLALQLRTAGERLLLDCDRLLAVLIARARAEAGTVMMGRNCGWLTAAAAQAYREWLDSRAWLPEIGLSREAWDVHGVYIPEAVFDLDGEARRLKEPWIGSARSTSSSPRARAWTRSWPSWNDPVRMFREIRLATSRWKRSTRVRGSEASLRSGSTRTR